MSRLDRKIKKTSVSLITMMDIVFRHRTIEISKQHKNVIVNYLKRLNRDLTQKEAALSIADSEVFSK